MARALTASRGKAMDAFADTAARLERLQGHAGGENTRPRNTDNGPMSICEAENAVVIQAPSSTPAPTAQRTSASPMEVSREARLVATAPTTATTPSHGKTGRVAVVID